LLYVRARFIPFRAAAAAATASSLQKSLPLFPLIVQLASRTRRESRNEFLADDSV
jgi:hypothetical protein